MDVEKNEVYMDVEKNDNHGDHVRWILRLFRHTSMKAKGDAAPFR
jgi:hypothetical protein